MTKIGIKYNLICENCSKKITSTPGPVMKNGPMLKLAKPAMAASPELLKQIKTSPTLVKELLAIIAKQNKATTQKPTIPVRIWFGTVEPDTYSKDSVPSTPCQSPTPQPVLARARACTPPTPPSQPTARKNPSAPRLRGEPLPQGIKDVIWSRIQAATIAAVEKRPATEPASSVLERPGYHVQIR